MVHTCHRPDSRVIVQIMFEFSHSLSPEPTAVGALRSAVAGIILDRRRLSFCR
jgi:hypothetical protein